MEASTLWMQFTFKTRDVTGDDSQAIQRGRAGAALRSAVVKGSAAMLLMLARN